MSRTNPDEYNYPNSAYWAACDEISRLRNALAPFAQIKPSSLHPVDGSETEGYSVMLFETDRLGHQLAPDFTGADLARAREVLGTPTKKGTQ